jgi:hypothetical protein
VAAQHALCQSAACLGLRGDLSQPIAAAPTVLNTVHNFVALVQPVAFVGTGLVLAGCSCVLQLQLCAWRFWD